MLFTFIFLILCANIYFVQSFRHVSFTNTLSKFGSSRSIKLLDAQKFTSFEDMLTKMDKPVLVDFFAQWCGPCKMMVPVLEDIAGRMENDLKVAKVDTDKYPRLGSRFQVEALPTLILFNKGEVVDRYIGYMNANDLEIAVKKSLAKLQQ